MEESDKDDTKNCEEKNEDNGDNGVEYKDEKSIRNERYKQLMASIHQFIIIMLKVHKEEVDIRKQQTDPFGKKEETKQQVAKRLEYAKEEESIDRISFAQLPQHAAMEEEQRRRLEEVRNFFTPCSGEMRPKINSKVRKGSHGSNSSYSFTAMVAAWMTAKMYLAMRTPFRNRWQPSRRSAARSLCELARRRRSGSLSRAIRDGTVSGLLRSPISMRRSKGCQPSPTKKTSRSLKDS